MHIAVRVDATTAIGLGHMMRCLTLAQLLKQHMNANVTFMMNHSAPAFVEEWLRDSGIVLWRMDESITGTEDYEIDARTCLSLLDKCAEIDWIIVDHYMLDYRWERMMLSKARKLMVIDDLANRRHECHVLLDQNLTSIAEKKYEGLLPEYCTPLLGPSCALLRNEFYRLKDRVRIRSNCRHVLISFGGSDPTNETGKVMEAIRRGGVFFDGINFTIIGGPSNSRNKELEASSNSLPGVRFYPQCSNMAELLEKVDLAIGAGGISLLERAYMGVPSCVITVADNQDDAVREAENRGMIWHLGRSGHISVEAIQDLLVQVINDKNGLQERSGNCISVMHSFTNDSVHPILKVIADN